MYIDDETKQRIEQAATLAAVLDRYYTEVKRNSRTVTYQCPFCQDGKLEYSIAKQLCKCFKCDYGTKSGIDLLMRDRKMEYIDVMEVKPKTDNLIDIKKEKPGFSRVSLPTGACMIR